MGFYCIIETLVTSIFISHAIPGTEHFENGSAGPNLVKIVEMQVSFQVGLANL